MIPSSSTWLASHVNRSANFCAHHVANWAATRSFSGCIPTLSFLSGPSLTCFGKASASTFLVPFFFVFFFIIKKKKKKKKSFN